MEFLGRVRDERKFETPEALKAQILRDVAAAQRYFRAADGLDRAARAGDGLTCIPAIF